MQAVRNLFHDFSHMKMYFLTTLIIFIAGIWMGAELSVFRNFLENQISGLAELSSTLDEMENKTFGLFMFIFFNNAIKAVAIVFLGLLFALLPVFFVVVNGMVLGFLFGAMHGAGENIIPLIVKGILPHGIIELPVILLASAYGIRMGTVLIKWLGSSGETRKTNKAAMFELLRITGPLSIFIVISLFAAAIIEATITPWLLSI